MVRIVFVHGHGRVPTLDEWLGPLNVGLEALGYPALRAQLDQLILVDYNAALTASELGRQAETYREPDDAQLLKQRHAFAARRAELNDLLRPYTEHGPDINLSTVPGGLRDGLASLTEFLKFPGVRKYIENEATRHAVWHTLVKQLPKRGPLIIVAHSLGTIVAADSLRRLPPGLRVELLVTMGSPLAFSRYRTHFRASGDAYPYERVRRWVNAYSPLDLVTGGRGISGHIDPALDVNIGLDPWCHEIGGYLSHASVAKAIGWIAFDNGRTTKQPIATERAAARRLHDIWTPELLAMGFTRELIRSLDAASWRKRMNLESARAEVARRRVAQIEDRRRALVRQLAHLEENGYPIPSTVNRNPLAEGRYPVLRDLTDDAAALLRGNLPDADLLPMAVGLMVEPVLLPFAFEVDTAWRTKALGRLFGRIRVGRRKVSDDALASQVRTSAAWAIDKLDGGSGFPLGPVLIAAGAVLLAATGVGLVAAAPAGLAGAAVITSTLAAFGPGGMAGGLLTLGALTGTGAGLLGAGVVTELGEDADERGVMTVAAQSGAALAAQPLPTLKSTVTAMIATVHAQGRLGMSSTEPVVGIALHSALDAARAEYHLHQAVNAASAGDWDKKISLLRRALDALDSLSDSSALTRTLGGARQAIEAGDERKVPASPPRLALE